MGAGAYRPDCKYPAAFTPPPTSVTERYLEIRTVPEQQVITVIEILSPSTKLTREGRVQYEGTRLKVLGSTTHLVEIDLLRAGHPFPMKAPGSNDYRIVISRSQHQPRADIICLECAT
jgi:hypothetical protein